MLRARQSAQATAGRSNGLLTLLVVAPMNPQMEEHSGGLDRLVAQAQQGDDASREQLLGMVRSGVLRYVLARGLPIDDAEDVAQETCLGLLRALPGWRDLGRPVWALVFAIAHNKIADRARAHAVRKEMPMDQTSYLTDIVTDPRPGPAELAEEDEGSRRVRALLKVLPTTQRDVLLLRVIVGMSTAETAATLSLTVGSVRVLQHRAVTTLRQKFVIAPGRAS
jgi:RNA polymerase sigma-70 factor (ECF subfamily)